MDQIDKKLLNRLQKDFPLSERPFYAIGCELGLSEEEVLKRTARLKEEGYIRRIGGVFNTSGLGFYSTLVAARVAPEKLEEVAAYISSFRGVTHNYERNHYYNLWFTLTCESEGKADGLLQEIKGLEGVEKLLKLPSLRQFKIDLNLNVR